MDIEIKAFSESRMENALHPFAKNLLEADIPRFGARTGGRKRAAFIFPSMCRAIMRSAIIAARQAAAENAQERRGKPPKGIAPFFRHCRRSFAILSPSWRALHREGAIFLFPPSLPFPSPPHNILYSVGDGGRFSNKTCCAQAGGRIARL